MSSGSFRGTRDRVRCVVERPAVRLRRDLPPGDRGAERRRGDEVALEPAGDVAVQERAAAGGDGPVLGVVGVGGERDEAVERVHEVVRGGLVRDVAQRRRARADLPQGLAARADGLVRPDPLADPGAPPGEAARLANRPLLVDLHRLERPLDRVQAQVPGAHPSFSYRTRLGHRAVRDVRPVAARSSSRGSRALVIGGAPMLRRSSAAPVPPVCHALGGRDQSSVGTSSIDESDQTSSSEGSPSSASCVPWPHRTHMRLGVVGMSIVRVTSRASAHHPQRV